MTEPPLSVIYSSVVGRESVRIELLVATLNHLDMDMFDISNAYLPAPTTEKLHTVLWEEFREDKGKLAIIKRVLYSRKTSDAAYCNHFANVLRDLGFESRLTDADMWKRPATKSNGFEYFEYILCYVDDCLVISCQPKVTGKTLKSGPYNYTLKDVGTPERCLGAKVGEYQLGNEKAWYMSAELYLHHAIKEIERKWGDLSKVANRRSLDIPANPKCHPEIDTSHFLNDDDTQLYQS